MAILRGLLAAAWLGATGCEAPLPPGWYVQLAPPDASAALDASGKLDAGAGVVRPDASSAWLDAAADGRVEAPPGGSALDGVYATHLRIEGQIMAGTQRIGSTVIILGLMLAELLENGHLRLRERACFVHIDDDDRQLSFHIDEGVVQSSAEPDALLVPDAQGEFLREERRLAVGFRPDSPQDAIPESSADPRVFDADGDGLPGVTVRAQESLFNQECRLAGAFDIRVGFTLAASAEGLYVTSAQDRNSQQRTLGQQGQCSDGTQANLLGASLDLEKLPAGTALDCAAHTASSLQSAL